MVTVAQSDPNDPYDPLTSIRVPSATGGLGTAYDPLTSIRVPQGVLLAGAPVEFTGRWPFGDPVVEESSTEVAGVTRNRGGIWQATLRGMSDPRLDGLLTSATDMDIHPPSVPDGTPVFVFAEDIRIENDRGAWQARPHVGFFIPDFTADDAMADWQIVLTGEGDYSGLTAMAWVDPHTSDSEGWIDVNGVIFAGSPPS
jgi:hypothetical protein